MNATLAREKYTKLCSSECKLKQKIAKQSGPMHNHFFNRQMFEGNFSIVNIVQMNELIYFGLSVSLK